MASKAGHRGWVREGDVLTEPSLRKDSLYVYAILMFSSHFLWYMNAAFILEYLWFEGCWSSWSLQFQFEGKKHVSQLNSDSWAAVVNRLWAIDANWCHIHSVRYGRLTPNGVKADLFQFFVHSARLLRSTSGLWLAADCRYSIMALVCADSN